MDENNLPYAVRETLQRARMHPHVQSVVLVSAESDDAIHVELQIRVNLPTKWLAAGHSPTGVNQKESVFFSFGPDFPINPPSIHLRADFNRALPHIQPGASGGLVEPCYLDGNRREHYAKFGIEGVINQLVTWLERAAKGDLIDPRQGWEPIRRDDVNDLLVADLDVIRNFGKVRGVCRFFRTNYLKAAKRAERQVSGKPYSSYAWINAESIPFNERELKQCGESKPNEGEISSGQTITLLTLPDKSPDGKDIVCNQYEPETVNNFDDLRNRAYQYGCGKVLDDAIRHIRTVIIRTYGPNPTLRNIPLVIALVARRPNFLIHTNSTLEIIPYLVEFSALFNFSGGNAVTVPVYPVAVREALSRELLARLSGINPDTLINRSWVQIGAGSLGSKIAVHLARAGQAPSVIVDAKNLSPHNAARHTILAPKDESNISWLDSKARVMSKLISGLDQPCKAVNDDVVSWNHNPKAAQKAIPNDTSLIVNSTASLAVRETLGAIKLHARVYETSLYAEGRVGLVTLEGPSRNPNTSDLVLEAYAIARENTVLTNAMFSDEPSVRPIEIGQGCNSSTMVVSDARISLHAAAMSENILEYFSRGLPAAGEIHLGFVPEKGIGLNWASHRVDQFEIVLAENAPGWEVHISPRAHAKIIAECGQHTLVETGGVIMGAVSIRRRVVTVIDVIAPPEDSIRQPECFILGSKGLAAEIDDYASSVGYALYCVGTWHSHLVNVGGSMLDYQVAEELQRRVSSPALALIKTPNDYRAVIGLA